MGTDPPRALVAAVLVVAVLAVSSAAVLVVAIDDAEPVAIAFWRTALVAALFAPGLRRAAWREVAWIALGGVALAAHFALWFDSLERTSVLRSTVLVTLNPAWAAVLEWTFLGQRPHARFWLGLALAVPGVALMATTEGAASLAGDVEALIAGMLGAAYFVVGRRVRPHVGIGTYGSLVAGFAALTLAPVALASQIPLVGYSWTTWLLLIALAVGPQTLGHNGFNWLLRHMPASTVATATLLEPVGATLLALAFLGQVPAPLSAAGGALVLVGVVTAARRPTPAAPRPAS